MGAPRGAEVRSALLATGKPYASIVADQVDLALERHAHAWRAAARANCRATRVDGDQSEAMLDLRSACLERRRAGLEIVLDLLVAGDHVPARALDLVDGLDPLEPCSDRDALAAGTPLPTDPAARARVAALEHSLARVRALPNGGRADEGLALGAAPSTRPAPSPTGRPCSTSRSAPQCSPLERVAGLARATDGLARVLAADDVSPEQALAARARMAELVALAGRPRAPPRRGAPSNNHSSGPERAPVGERLGSSLHNRHHGPPCAAAPSSRDEPRDGRRRLRYTPGAAPCRAT